MRLLFFLLFLFHGFCVQRIEDEYGIKEIENPPLDIVVHRYVANYYQEQEDLRSGKSQPADIFARQETLKKEQNSVFDHITRERLFTEYARIYNQSDEMVQSALRGLTKEIIVYLNVLAQTNGGVSIYGNPVSLFNSYTPRVQYEYAYGKELSRETLDEYEMIVRQTYFENKEHNVDIDIDFLKPIQKVIEKLKLQDKFQWFYKQKLYFGYHSHFVHKKKIFMRHKGFYAKISVTFELLRREKNWWGTSGDWKVFGKTSKLEEQPAAVVAREVSEID